MNPNVINELIPECICMGSRVCIDYHKLNNATRKTFHFHSLIRCCKGSLDMYTITLGRMFRIQPNFHSTRWLGEDCFHVSLWHLCLWVDVLRLIQCHGHIFVLYDIYFLGHGGTYHWGFHGWFLYLWKVIQGMSRSFGTSTTAVWRHGPCAKLRTVSFPDLGRDHVGIFNISKEY